MESGDHLILEASLYNYYKIYPRVEIESNASQRLVRVYLENKDKEIEDWYLINVCISLSGLIGGMLWRRLKIQDPVMSDHGQNL
jgi:hypothetical protein